MSVVYFGVKSIIPVLKFHTQIKYVSKEKTIKKQRGTSASAIAYHNTPKKFPCDLCPRSFKQSGDLKKHVKEIHQKIKDNFCDHCEMAFCRPYQLKKHVQEVHEKIKNHKCETCGKCFSQSGIYWL